MEKLCNLSFSVLGQRETQRQTIERQAYLFFL